MTDGLEAAREDQWAAARRVVSDDHPTDCPCIRDHLEVSFIHGMEYTTERTGESALRAAAQEVAGLAESIADHIDDMGGSGGDIVRSIASTLKSALGGAPWEPSEDQVERAAEAGWRAIDTDDDWALIEEKNRAPWRIFAHAVLKAAMGSATTT